MKSMELVISLFIRPAQNSRLRISCFCLALLSIASIGCENDIEKVKLVTGKDQTPIEHATGLSIVYSDSSVMKVRVVAKLMNRFQGEDPYTEMPDGVKVEFFDKEMIESEEVISLFAFFGQQLSGFGRFQGFIGDSHYKFDRIRLIE